MKSIIRKLSGALVMAAVFAGVPTSAEVFNEGPEMPQVRRLANDMFFTANTMLWELERNRIPGRFYRGSYNRLVREVAEIRSEALSYQSAVHSEGFAHQVAGDFFQLGRSFLDLRDMFIFREARSIRLNQLYQDMNVLMAQLSQHYMKVEPVGDWRAFDSMVDYMEDYTDQLEKMGKRLDKRIRTPASEFAKDRVEDLENAMDRLDYEIDHFGVGSPAFIAFLYADVQSRIAAVAGLKITHKELFDADLLRQMEEVQATFTRFHESYMRAIDGK